MPNASTGKKISKKIIISRIAEDADLEALWHRYRRAFEPKEVDPEQTLEDEEVDMDHAHLDMVMAGLGDLGVEEEAMKTLQELSVGLGFSPCGLPRFFATTHNKNDLNGWDHPDRYSVGADATPGYLMWHQVASVHAMVRKTFYSQAEPEGPTGKLYKDKVGLLLADEVGLGKTVQLLAYIAFLMQVQEAQVRSTNLPIPPIVGESSVSIIWRSAAQVSI